jgi:hypothetical protein
MTYLLSVSSAIINKRSLALCIQSLGTSPRSVSKSFLELPSSARIDKVIAIENILNTHSVNHHAYPVLHYYQNPDRRSSLSLNFAILDEAISQLLHETEDEEFRKILSPLRRAMDHYMLHIHENYIHQEKPEAPEDLPSYPSTDLPGEGSELPEDWNRRRILGFLLHSECFEWEDVYSAN